MMNLISNAYKFTPEGGTVSVILTEGTRKGEKADYVLRVRDNGIGMSKEFASRVFDSFERERTSTVSNVQGTGLGMAITRSIVDMMGGTIEVETEQGKGTEFTIRVSLETATEEDLKKPVRHEYQCDCAEGLRLLLAEDVEVNREIAVMMLTSMGFMIETAVNGREAVDMIIASEPGHYDAVLMDIQMPVMNGYEAAEMIRSLPEPELASIPIVAVTANAFAEDIQKHSRPA
jgi:CheY-like chemotaxis protein/anti-sigma regulatory factor (Ser/Thr protein kinase)